MIKIKDSEDIIRLITAYIKEDIGDGVTRINDFIQKENAEKGNDDLMPDINSDVLLGQRLKEIQTQKGGWLNLAIEPEIVAIPNYDTTAIVYVVELSYILREDFSDITFLKSLRMQTVLKDLMNSFFKNEQIAGFMKGEIESLFSPTVVLLGNKSFPKIASGIIYNLTLY